MINNSNLNNIFVLVDKEFIEERRRSLKRYLEILCRHPIICETEIIKFSRNNRKFLLLFSFCRIIILIKIRLEGKYLLLND